MGNFFTFGQFMALLRITDSIPIDRNKRGEIKEGIMNKEKGMSWEEFLEK